MISTPRHLQLLPMDLFDPSKMARSKLLCFWNSPSFFKIYLGFDDKT